MPEMDGYELLKIVKKKLGIPVILMSINPRMEIVIKGIQEGACYFLHKPMSINLVRSLWTHVAWKKFSDDKELRRLRRESEKGKAPLVFYSSPPDDRARSKGIKIDDGSSKAKMVQVEEEEEDDSVVPKKRRIVWTAELNRKFEDAIQQLGIENAVPSKIAELMNVEGIDRHHVGSHLQKYRTRLRQEQERQEEAFLFWNQFHPTMNPSYQAGYMGMGPNTIGGPSSNPVLMPQAAIHPTCVSAAGTGKAVLGSFSGSVLPQQVGGCAQQYYNTNCLPYTTFGGTYVGMNDQTFSSYPAQNIRNENTTVPVSGLASFNNTFQAPGTSTPVCHAAGGLAPSGLPMGSNQSPATNTGQENPRVHEAGGSSAPTEEDEIERFLKEFFKDEDW